MREIEFRGKRSDNGEWVYGNYSKYGKAAHAISLPNEDSEDGIEYGCLVDPETVCEYTGLKDKNGVKIFEGDIVCYKTMNLPVRWDDERSGFFIGEDKYWMMNDCDLEVIGNIHDNPELLGELRALGVEDAGEA